MGKQTFEINCSSLIEIYLVDHVFYLRIGRVYLEGFEDGAEFVFGDKAWETRGYYELISDEGGVRIPSLSVSLVVLLVLKL